MFNITNIPLLLVIPAAADAFVPVDTIKPILTFLAILIVTFAILKLTNSSSTIPGPTGYPLIGDSLEFFSYGMKKKVDVYHSKLFAKYGDIVQFKTISDKFVIVRDIEAMKAFMYSPYFDRSEMISQRFDGLFNDALFALPDGEKWRKHRRLLVKAFDSSHLKYGAKITAKVANNFAKFIAKQMSQNNTDSHTIDMQPVFSGLALDVISQIIFSYSFNAFESIAIGENNIHKDMFDEMGNVAILRLTVPPMFWKMCGIQNGSERMTKLQAHFDDIINKLIKHKRHERQIQKAESTDRDLMDFMLDTADDPAVPFDKKLTEDEVRGETMGFFTAGHVTTASSMTFIFYELAKSPETQKKLQAEIDAFVAQGTDLDLQSLHTLKYLDAVIKESMRLHPITPYLARTITTDVLVHDHLIEKGNVIMGCIQDLQRHPKYWSDPNDFIPERWEQSIVRGSYMPFGEGPMNCIGQKLALIEMKMLTFYIIKEFNMVIEAGQNLDTEVIMSPAFVEGIKIKFTKRS